MSSYKKMLSALNSADAISRFEKLYGTEEKEITRQKQRYIDLVKTHEQIFHAPDQPLFLVSAPGRSEIIGNHTDHNNGKVLAAAVNLDCLAAVSPRGDMQARIVSQGYPEICLSLDDLSVHPEEAGTSASLVRGVAKGMAEKGFRLGGFDAAVTSDVLGGSGLSSSAAYEVLICAVIDTLYNGFSMAPTPRAQIAQFAENVYFGKPSGLMDQMACSTGGLVTIDFKNEPRTEALSFRFSQAGYVLAVVNTGGSHDSLTDEYAAIRTEMEKVASFFGKKVLRSITREQLNDSLFELRKEAGDRAILRAMHYFDENDRVDRTVQAIRRQDTEAILAEMSASGESSWKLLQNVFCVGKEQPMTLALALANNILSGRGASRVHGGGFAGTTLNAVPTDLVSEFVCRMEAVFGKGSCFILDVRPVGPEVVFSVQ